jgi:hypothetical protein
MGVAGDLPLPQQDVLQLIEFMFRNGEVLVEGLKDLSLVVEVWVELVRHRGAGGELPLEPNLVFVTRHILRKQGNGRAWMVQYNVVKALKVCEVVRCM